MHEHIGSWQIVTVRVHSHSRFLITVCGDRHVIYLMRRVAGFKKADRVIVVGYRVAQLKAQIHSVRGGVAVPHVQIGESACKGILLEVRRGGQRGRVVQVGVQVEGSVEHDVGEAPMAHGEKHLVRGHRGHSAVVGVEVGEIAEGHDLLVHVQNVCDFGALEIEHGSCVTRSFRNSTDVEDVRLRVWVHRAGALSFQSQSVTALSQLQQGPVGGRVVPEHLAVGVEDVLTRAEGHFQITRAARTVRDGVAFVEGELEGVGRDVRERLPQVGGVLLAVFVVQIRFEFELMGVRQNPRVGA